ncbi:MAG: hypothetical protein KAR05_06410 [Candidatus Omnitrophica bacterium]|nr:hypothetical protein [Candidatus Omnitrophota bacterium]
MRKALIFLLIGLMGCASVQIPAYVKDKKPYTKRFYANYEQAYEALNKTLLDLGWEIEGTMDPAVYEQDSSSDLDEKKTLVLTHIRQTPLFIGTRYAKMNIFLRSKKKISEFEIRYVTVTSLLFKNFTSYRNDSAAERMFEYLDKTIKENK